MRAGSRRRRLPGRGLVILILVAILVLVAAAVLWQMFGSRTERHSPTLLDRDPRDSPEQPWPRPDSGPLTVYFVTSDLSSRYSRLVHDAADIWSRSSSVTAIAAPSCPPEAHCVRIVEKKRSHAQRHTDGEFAGDDHHGVRRGGRITLYTHPLDRSTDNGALATIVHEMGHALGLVHRIDEHDVMNSHTNDHTNPVPDAIDFANLEALYGRHRP